MSSQSIVCASCNQTVPYGRLSCPGCGELLASVAGAPRRELARVAQGAGQVGVAGALRDRAASRTGPASSLLVDVAPPSAPVEADPAAITPEPEPLRSEPAALASQPDWPDPASEWRDPRTASRAATDDRPAPEEPSLPSVLEPVAIDATSAFALGSATVLAPAAVPAAAPSIANAPGAYVPPVIPPELAAGPPAPARAWGGHHAADNAATESGASERSTPHEILASARVTEFVGWLAVAGSAMSAVGFLLPWGMSVIGASGVGYFDRWGLAGPYHPVVLLGVLAVLAGALIPNRIPLWLRVGMPCIGLGALVVGLVWPYMVGLAGTGPGALLVALGGILMAAAGVTAIVVDRVGHHGDEDRPV